MNKVVFEERKRGIELDNDENENKSQHGKYFKEKGNVSTDKGHRSKFNKGRKYEKGNKPFHRDGKYVNEKRDNIKHVSFEEDYSKKHEKDKNRGNRPNFIVKQADKIEDNHIPLQVEIKPIERDANDISNTTIERMQKMADKFPDSNAFIDKLGPVVKIVEKKEKNNIYSSDNTGSKIFMLIILMTICSFVFHNYNVLPALGKIKIKMEYDIQDYAVIILNISFFAIVVRLWIRKLY